MRMAVVGCGYVADFYARNLSVHPDLSIVSAYDSDLARRDAWCSHFKIPAAESLDAILADPTVDMVLNLTNPRSHMEVSSAILRAGKHLYSEKPLGMTLDEAKALVALADAEGVRIGCAPCNMLNDTVRTVAETIRAGTIGKVRLAYANYDDGMIAPAEKPWNWRSESGAPWPAKDEFEIGCTYEHAGYYLTVLSALFGPARTVTAFASTQIHDKGIPVDGMAPDFSVGCIEYDDGVVARVTAGLVAPVDKSLTIVGDDGVLVVRYLRNDRERILVKPRKQGRTLAGIVNKVPAVLRKIGLPLGEFMLYPRSIVPEGKTVSAGKNKPVDFLRGPQDMADAIRENRPHRLSGEFAVHVVEQIEALQYPARYGYHRVIESDYPAFDVTTA